MNRAKDGDDQPCGANSLAAIQGNDAKGDLAQGANPRPEQLCLNPISAGNHCIHLFPPTSRFNPNQTERVGSIIIRGYRSCPSEASKIKIKQRQGDRFRRAFA
jgi:hypothetical protein